MEGPEKLTMHWIQKKIMLAAKPRGFHLAIPVTDGRLNLGTWQGICLAEHRTSGGARKLVVTVFGERMVDSGPSAANSDGMKGTGNKKEAE